MAPHRPQDGQPPTSIVDLVQQGWVRADPSVTVGGDALVNPRRIDYYNDPEAPKANSLVRPSTWSSSTTQARSC